jgi:CheY-like chemotaxis protein
MTSTLLLADDSVTIQRVIELTLANEDVRVIAVADGESALRRINDERPDIVLADVGVPKLDGYAVASHIKRSPELRTIPVLLLTGAFEPVDEDRARDAGCDGILVKPFEPQQLVGRVRELLAGRMQPRPETLPIDATLELEFTRLNAVFARLDVRAEPEAADPAPAQTFEGWDLPERPSSSRPAPPLILESSAVAPSAGGPVAAPPAGDGERTLPPAGSAPPPVVTEAMVEQVVRRVLAGMSEESVRRLIADTAERVIRQEIERIKTTPR